MEQLTVQIPIHQILEKLEANKNRFVQSFNRLLSAYDKKASKYQKEYLKFVAKVKTQKLSKDEIQPQPPIEPKNRAKDYDFYIEMIRLHDLPTINLSEENFRKLWKDQWTWIHSHIMALNAFADEDAKVEEALSWYAVEA